MSVQYEDIHVTLFDSTSSYSVDLRYCSYEHTNEKTDGQTDGHGYINSTVDADEEYMLISTSSAYYRLFLLK